MGGVIRMNVGSLIIGFMLWTCVSKIVLNSKKVTVCDRAARTGRNPQTGEEIQITASRVHAIKPGKELKEAVKNSIVILYKALWGSHSPECFFFMKR
ncbi:HU family DNA-binding protein [Bacillus sp. ISL-4]|nr:HU family DNA-binding protein [Bacillus sp. ISL-4]MBT2673932.1 HU family DNA-binding protein [Streptomyces sp. ISL-14]